MEYAVNEQMENNIAGALLIDPELVFQNIRPFIQETDFINPCARAIFSAVSSYLSAGVVPDSALILKKANELEPMADEEYCRQAMDVTPSCRNASEYAKAVHSAAVEKQEQEIGMKIAMGQITGFQAVSQLQDLSRSRANTIMSPREAADSMMDFLNANEDGKMNLFVPTELDPLDEILSGGLIKSGLITLAARPGTGKTTAGISISENVAGEGTTVLYISLEMSMQQIWACRLAAWSGQNRSEIYTGKYTSNRAYDPQRKAEINSKKEAVCKAVEALSKHPFYIRDKASTVEDIEREAASIPNLGLIVVDHIGLIKPAAGSSRSRYEIMTEISHQLKQLALTLKIPILALCQLNRSSLDRKDSRPTMADLRDSGAIEEDSDVVILLFRDMECHDDTQRIRFIIDKNRHGPVGDVDLRFIAAQSRICI